MEFNALRFINYTIPRLCSTHVVATLDKLKMTGWKSLDMTCKDELVIFHSLDQLHRSFKLTEYSFDEN